jgi:hypothetical protein
VGREGRPLQIAIPYPQSLLPDQRGRHPTNDQRVAPSIVGRPLVHMAHRTSNLGSQERQESIEHGDGASQASHVYPQHPFQLHSRSSQQLLRVHADLQ